MIWSSAQLAEIHRFRADDWSHRKIARHYGVTRYAIDSIVKRLRKGHAVGGKPRWSDDVEAKLLELHEAGQSVDSIARVLNRTTWAVQWKLGRLVGKRDLPGLEPAPELELPREPLCQFSDDRYVAGVLVSRALGFPALDVPARYRVAA